MTDTGLNARRNSALRALAQRPDISRFPGETRPSGALPDDPDEAARFLNARNDIRTAAFNEAADLVAETLKDTPEYGEYIADLLRHHASAEALAARAVHQTEQQPRTAEEAAGQCSADSL